MKKEVNKEVKKEVNKEKVIQEILSYIRTLACYMLVAYIICNKIVTHASVPSGSMEDTIMTGSRVIVNRTAYWMWEPERGDIVAFELPDDQSQLYLKRIIGLPGEVIEGLNGEIYINGSVLTEPYIHKIFRDDFGPFQIPEDSYFMMGDNRNNSYDSRFWNQKFVNREAIVGEVGIEIYPELKLLK